MIPDQKELMLPKIEIEIRPDGSRRVKSYNDEPSLTQQQFKDECDVNNLMNQYRNDMRFVPFGNKGVFADVTEITDYRESLDRVLAAEEAFNALPADLRYRFNNNPAELLSFVQNPNNYDEGVKLGLFNPKPIEEPPIKTKTQNKTKTGDDPKIKTPEPKTKLDEE